MIESQRLEIVDNFDNVPDFATEAEEAHYWATHELGDNILDRMEAMPEEGILSTADTRTRPVVVRLDEDTLQRINMLAARRQIGYQTLLEEFVAERLSEEEKREGLRAS